MEEKQLDFNQRLLSVRRFSPKMASETEKKSKTSSRNSLTRSIPLPAYKSDLKSGPVSHPGAVPFIWEHTPGRPKNEGKLPTLGVEEHPPLTPNLPPGRASSRVKHQDSDSDQVSKGSNIPKGATKQKILKELMQEKDSSDSDDEAYEDALDTLSTTESFFMNCSASGLSGLEDDQETKPFGSFSSDLQQARSFMIDRFLPAAKAIASGSPQYNSRKPPPVVAQEEPQKVKEIVLVSRQRHSPLRQIVLSQYAHQDIGEEESDEDEDDNESDGSENNATKVCGLFPRLCFLNPLPELRMEAKVLSSAATHNGTRKEHARISHREKKSVYPQFGFREEKVKNVSRKLSARESTQCDFGLASSVVEKTLYIDSVHRVESHSNSSYSAMKGQSQTNHTWDPFETSIQDNGYCEKPSIIVPRSSESLDFPCACCPDRSINGTQIDLAKPLEHEIDLDKNLSISSPRVAQCKTTLSDNSVIINRKNFDGSIQKPAPMRRSRLARDFEVDLKSLLAAHSTDQECSKVISNGKTDLENQCQKKAGNEEVINLRFPLSLPSPKAPSESWLERTLPTISFVTARIPASSRIANNTATHYPKWERIVKSSEELLTTIPED